MADRPAIQFYFGDWKKNQKLRFCSWGARGAWIEVMGLMHDSPEYGVLRQPLKKIAQALGAPMKLLNELVAQGVMYGCASGTCEPMVYRPKHAGAEGDPVVLVAAQEGPIWYSPRMVKDEYVRTIRGTGTRFKASPDGTPKGGYGEPPKPQPNSATMGRQGDGASASASASKSSSLSPGASAHDDDPPGVTVIDGQTGLPSTPPPSVLAELTPAQAKQAVLACTALRKMGAPPRIHPGDELLAALMAEGFTAEQVVRAVGEKALRDAALWNDPFLSTDLPELLINGANQQAMGLTDTQHTALRSAVAQVSIAYIAATLRGRRRDATQPTGTTHGKSTHPAHGGSGAPRSAVERVKAANAEAERREAAGSK